MTNLDNQMKALDKPGRDKFKLLCSKLNLIYEEPSFDKLAYDCTIKYKGRTYLVELKDRNIKYNVYDTLYLEKYKYDCLKRWKKSLNAAGIFYVNWIGNKAYIFNLDDDKIFGTQLSKPMNKITAMHNNIKVKKDVYVLKKSDAKVHTI